MGTDAVQIQIAEHDRRLGGHHKRIGATEVKVADHDRSIAVLDTEVEDLDGKINKIEAAIEKSDEKRETEGVANRRALYAVAGFMATFSLTLCGLIAVLVSHA